MSLQLEQNSRETDNREDDGSRRKVFIIAGAVAALIVTAFVAGIVYVAYRPQNTAPARLEGAIRPGTPEFEQCCNSQRLIVDEPEAYDSERLVGGIGMDLRTIVRNFTGRTITGLEMRAAVVDLDGNVVKERTTVVIPGRQNELENNRTLLVPIRLEGFSRTAVRANIRMEVTGVRLQ